MDVGYIVIGVLVGALFIYSMYEHFKPASGERARNAKGHFVKDDPNTPHINEAYKDGKKPAKKKRKAPVKKKAVKAKAKPRRKTVKK